MVFHDPSSVFCSLPSLFFVDPSAWTLPSPSPFSFPGGDMAVELGILIHYPIHDNPLDPLFGASSHRIAFLMSKNLSLDPFSLNCSLQPVSSLLNRRFPRLPCARTTSSSLPKRLQNPFFSFSVTLVSPLRRRAVNSPSPFLPFWGPLPSNTPSAPLLFAIRSWVKILGGLFQSGG